MYAPRLLPVMAIGLLGAIPALAAAPDAAPPDPKAVVTAFNAALSRRDLNAAMATLLRDGVQFNLRPAHQSATATAPAGEAPKVSGELRTHWLAIAPVLFSATKSYTRRVEILDARVDGDLATVWVRTSTESVRNDASPPARAAFSEIYLLVRQGGAWKIAVMADNRGTDGLGVTQPKGP